MKCGKRGWEAASDYKSRPSVKQSLSSAKKKSNRKHREARRKYERRYAGMVDPPGDAPPGTCHICGEHSEKLNCDHDHETGRVRGWLCRTCNLTLGYMKDSPKRLAAAINYLTIHGKQYG